jgi:hypothetical protein
MSGDMSDSHLTFGLLLKKFGKNKEAALESGPFYAINFPFSLGYEDK